MLSVIVPTAVSVAPEMEVDFGPLPPALVPIGGKVAAERIIEQYPDARVYFAVHENGQLVEEHFDFFPNPRVQVVQVGKTISIADTIAVVLQKQPEILDGPLILNFADTIALDVDPALYGQDFVVYADTIESQRWTLAKTEAGRITALSDKEFQFDASNWRMLLGIWGFSSAQALQDLLEKHGAKNDRQAFYKAIVDACNLADSAPQWVKSADYIDCGHADNYYAARRKLINARYFNSLSFNETAGTIRKVSENKEKLVDEINWLHELPKELRPFTATIFDYSKDPLAPFLEIEFYAYPSLDDAFVHSRFDFDTWVKVFDRLLDVIHIASKYQVRDADLSQDLRQMYVDKTRERTSKIDFSQLPSELQGESFDLNGRTTAGLQKVDATLQTRLECVGALEADEFQVIHGDLCLGNILYDPKHGLVKLIDARGSFGRYSIYGDVYYDLAKLSHSILGHYDFIMADRFRIDQSGRSFSIQVKASPYHETVGEIFSRAVESRGYDLKRIRAIESLLFLSMVPLHKDRPMRQQAMLLQGLSLFEHGETAA